MYNKLQALQILSMLAAVVHLNSAFCNATTAYMHRREAIIQCPVELSALNGAAAVTGRKNQCLVG